MTSALPDFVDRAMIVMPTRRQAMNDREGPSHISILINAALRPFAWVCLMALMAASWTPGQEMIRTGYNTRLEHALAYLITTFAVALAYPRLHTILLAVLMIAYAAFLEAGQVFVAGRHSGLFDWIASSTGALCGCCIISLARNRSS